jgi:hypothetical protein
MAVDYRYGDASSTQAMPELLLFIGVLAAFGLAFWLTTDSDDDNGGGGLMQPVLIPVRSRPQR